MDVEFVTSCKYLLQQMKSPFVRIDKEEQKMMKQREISSQNFEFNSQFFGDLSNWALIHISSYLDPKSLCAFASTCKNMNV